MGLLETIYLQRTTDAGRLSPAQQARLVRDQRLRAALEENAMLAPPQFPPEPDFNLIAAQAYVRAQAVPRGPQRATIRPLRLGWAVAGVLAVAGLVLPLLLIPHRAGWARMDGYILRYPLVYPGYANCTFYPYIPGPPKELSDRVTVWAAQHADSAPDGWELGVAYTSGFNWEKDEPWVKAHKRLPLVQAAVQEVTLVGGDKALLDSLLDATREIPHVGAPEIVSQSWFYHERLSQLYSKQDTLIINGKKYTFPQDFTPDDAVLFGTYCGQLVKGQPWAYAFFKPDIERRYGLGTICKLERLKDDTVRIDALTQDPVFADLDVPQPYCIGLSLSHEFTTAQITRELYQIAKTQAKNKQQEYKEQGGWGIVVPLLPRERFEGALSGALPAKLSPEEMALTEARYAELRACFDEWGKQNKEALAATHHIVCASPEAIYTSRSGNAGSGRIQDYDRVCLAFTAELRVDDPALRDSLLASLSQAKLVHPPLLWELYTLKVPLSELQGPGGAKSVE